MRCICFSAAIERTMHSTSHQKGRLTVSLRCWSGLLVGGRANDLITYGCLIAGCRNAAMATVSDGERMIILIDVLSLLCNMKLHTHHLSDPLGLKQAAVSPLDANTTNKCLLPVHPMKTEQEVSHRWSDDTPHSPPLLQIHS